MSECELLRRAIVQRRVRTFAIVVIAPGSDLAPCVEQVAEPTRVQAFLAQAAVETFDVGVLDRLAGADVRQFDLPFDRPIQIRAGSELQAVIAADALRRAAWNVGSCGWEWPVDVGPCKAEILVWRDRKTHQEFMAGCWRSLRRERGGELALLSMLRKSALVKRTQAHSGP